LDNVVVPPTHTVAVPVVAAGEAFTVSVREVNPTQPALLVTVYETITGPAEVPVTAPEVELIVAKPPPELTVHIPPLTGLVIVTGEPMQPDDGVGLIVPADGNAFTVTACDIAHPVDNV
jgi:hypothetical protein